MYIDTQLYIEYLDGYSCPSPIVQFKLMKLLSFLIETQHLAMA